MGLWSWIRGRNKAPRPPWVRPEFLGLFALIAAGALGLAFFASTSPSPTPSSPAVQHQYVGIQPEELAQELPCEPECYAQWLLDAWIRDHPEATVVEVTPRSHAGVVIGYDIAYLL